VSDERRTDPDWRKFEKLVSRIEKDAAHWVNPGLVLGGIAGSWMTGASPVMVMVGVRE
jgi:hypothetical protein